MNGPFETMLAAWAQLFEPVHFLYLTGGVFFGLVIGILPGLGGIAGLTLLLPYVYGMEPSLALAMMVGMLSATATSDTFPSVLMGIPGTSGSQATVVDGFPLAKKGEGARALGAGFAASLCGGLFGAFLLSIAIFGVRPVILYFGFAEQFMLVVFGLSMVGVLTGRSVFKGLAACCVGLMLGSVGAAPATGDLRMSFGSTYLSDGIPLVIVGLAMFAIPEVIDLLSRRKAIVENQKLGLGMLTGVRDAIRHRWIILRCSAIGSLVGALPGLGGSVVDWIAYGHVVQTSRDRDNFGKGDIRGVIAPESANNAKEGGALVPTLLFGIPGSGAMAVLLGGFILVGVEPGVGMLRNDLDLTFIIIWSLAIGNVIVVLMCLGLARPVALLTTVPYTVVGPFILVIVMFASFQATRSWNDVATLAALGAVGLLMMRFGWPRPALLIGFVLSSRLEASVYQTAQIYGLSIFERPIALVLLALTIGVIVLAVIQRRTNPKEEVEKLALTTRPLQIAFALVLLAFAGFVAWDASGFGFMARVYPLSVATLGLILIAIVIGRQAMTHRVVPELADSSATAPRETPLGLQFAWFLGLGLLGYLVGFPIAAGLFLIAYLALGARLSLVKSVAIGVATSVIFMLLARYLSVAFPAGLIPDMLNAPRWIGG
ncbi:tripartite tricarboxylate transporter permease [Acuticoccus sp. M5D2P5]|uniref:tripartite tricarboxylate transporter permease n=1 Tax=Acuticoccus kalidii TaxID=2910977 RepID=UPI001F3A339C|nr:tripartite tricarboxylate transporter permease [Acuticoccus kalidii]MCF3935568.1 tripartite tricarboxylate transporter permease [Acuticoccus kalidii]